MTSIQLNCPTCGKTLKLNAGTAVQLNITCPKCKTPFTATINRSQPASSVLDLDFTDPTPGQHARRGQYSMRSAPAAHTRSPAQHSPITSYPSFHTSAKKDYRPIFFIVGGILMGLGLIVCVILVTVVAPNMKEIASSIKESVESASVDSSRQEPKEADSRLPNDSYSSEAGSVSNTVSALTSSFDTRESVLDDLLVEIKRIGGYGIPLKNQPGASTAQLQADQKVIWGLMFRAARLKPETLSASQANSMLAKFNSPEQQQKVMMARSSPLSFLDGKDNEFWISDPRALVKRDPVQAAILELDLMQSIVVLMANLSQELPDPMKGGSLDPAWSQINRQQMSKFQLVARFERDFSREVIFIDPNNIDAAKVDRLFEVIDRYVELAQAIASTPYLDDKSHLGKSAPPPGMGPDVRYHMRDVPLNTFYELHARAASSLRSSLHTLYVEELGPAGTGDTYYNNLYVPPVPTEAQFKLAFAFDESKDVRNYIEDLFYWHQIDIHGTASERFESLKEFHKDRAQGTSLNPDPEEIADRHRQRSARGARARRADGRSYGHRPWSEPYDPSSNRSSNIVP